VRAERVHSVPVKAGLSYREIAEKYGKALKELTGGVELREKGKES